MKKQRDFIRVLFLLLLFLTAFTNLKAYYYEIAFVVKNSQGRFASYPVYVYTYDQNSRNLVLIRSGQTSSDSLRGSDSKAIFVNSGGVYEAINGWADIGTGTTVDNPNPIFSTLPGGGVTFYIRIDNQYCILTFTFEGGINLGDMTLYYQQGGTISASFYNQSKYEISGTGTWNEKTITLKNDFGSDRTSSYGNIHFNSMTLTNVGYSDTTLTREAQTFPHTIAGEDNQYVNSYYRKWRNWSNNYTGISYDLAITDNYNLTAIYAKQVNATISLNPSGSTIKLNGNTITGNQYLYDDQPYTFAAEDHVSSTWISYTFDHWVYDGSTVTNNTITINNPTGHHSLAAYFIGTARQDPMNIHFTSTDGQYISLAWTEHPNSNVTQYEVWRAVTGGSTESIATLNRGTTSFTDGAYIQNPNGVTKLFYTVKAYYSPSGTWNDPGYLLNRGDLDFSIAHNNNNQLNVVGKELPEGYSIGNYPNPFNPTTTINYQLPQDGFVTIKVYDVLGKEVATLVNENKQAGYYNINFDASRLTSGVYIYTINVNGFVQSKKMLLMK